MGDYLQSAWLLASGTLDNAYFWVLGIPSIVVSVYELVMWLLGKELRERVDAWVSAKLHANFRLWRRVVLATIVLAIAAGVLQAFHGLRITKETDLANQRVAAAEQRVELQSKAQREIVEARLERNSAIERAAASNKAELAALSQKLETMEREMKRDLADRDRALQDAEKRTADQAETIAALQQRLDVRSTRNEQEALIGRLIKAGQALLEGQIPATPDGQPTPEGLAAWINKADGWIDDSYAQISGKISRTAAERFLLITGHFRRSMSNNDVLDRKANQIAALLENLNALASEIRRSD